MTTLQYTEITNECSCQNYDADTDTFTDSEYCYGVCWDDTLEMFSYDVADLLEKNPSGVWRIEGLPLWSGSVDGYGEATTASELLRIITVNSSWILRYAIDNDEIHAVLSHHDVPMGGKMTISIAKDTE